MQSRRAGLIAGLVGALAITAIASAAGGTSVGTHKTKRGTVLASVHGYSLYNFAKDKQGGKSTCYGQCAKVWPPLLTSGKPVALRGSGVNSKLLGTTKRNDASSRSPTTGGRCTYTPPIASRAMSTAREPTSSAPSGTSSNTAGKLVKPKSGGVCDPLCPGY